MSTCDMLHCYIAIVLFFCGTNPMTSSELCTLQQSLMYCWSRCVRMKVSLQNMLAGMYGFHMHAKSIVSQQKLVEC